MLVLVDSGDRVHLHPTDGIPDRLPAFAVVTMVLAGAMAMPVFFAVCHRSSSLVVIYIIVSGY
jgi:hypothetical protein